MKKALAILSALALVAGVASAEVKIGAWGRTLFVPMANSGADNAKSYTGNIASWDWQGIGGTASKGRIGATIAGSSDNVGFAIDLNGDGGTIGAGDEQKVWVKPLDMLKISAGRVQVDTLRGNADFGSFAWFRSFGDGSFGEDFTFRRLGGFGTQSVMFELTPVEGLFVGINLDKLDQGLTENMLLNSQYAVGYTIANVGQIRGQYIGSHNAGTNKEEGTIQAAFKFTGVENLYADVGYSMCIIEKSPSIISLYGKYKIDAATIHASGRVVLPSSGDMGMYFGAGLDYGLADGVGITADVRYTNKILAGTTKDKITFMAGATKGFSNGVMGIAVQGIMGGAAGEKFGYAVPVRFEYWF